MTARIAPLAPEIAVAFAVAPAAAILMLRIQLPTAVYPILITLLPEFVVVARIIPGAIAAAILSAWDNNALTTNVPRLQRQRPPRHRRQLQRRRRLLRHLPRRMGQMAGSVLPIPIAIPATVR